VVNLQQIHIQISHHTLNMSLHYLVKYECQKTGANLKYILWLMIPCYNLCCLCACFCMLIACVFLFCIFSLFMLLSKFFRWIKLIICKSQGSIAKHFSCDVLLHYIYIFESAGERIFNIGKHLANLQAKRLIVSYTPFALDVCRQRYRTRQISKITCV